MRWLLIALLCAAGWYGYGYWKNSRPLPTAGNGELVLFTSDVCHQPCADARALLKELPVAVEEVLVTNSSSLSRWVSS